MFFWGIFGYDLINVNWVVYGSVVIIDCYNVVVDGVFNSVFVELVVFNSMYVEKVFFFCFDNIILGY